MKQKIKQFFYEFTLLLRSVPPLTFAVFILAVFAMNLLANKSLNLNLEWLALDCGIIVSWAVFLCMDVLTKRFGPQAATTLSLVAVGINLISCLILYLASLIPGTWGAFYDFGEIPEINSALDGTFGGTWYVVIGSTAAFVVSAIINNFSNWGIGKIFRKNPNGFGAYACRTYLSTAVGQFADNLLFALIVSHVFFGWTFLQCFTCAATGMVAELLCEIIFSPLGYKICSNWEKNGMGKAYLDYISSKSNNCLNPNGVTKPSAEIGSNTDGAAQETAQVGEHGENL